ncbi:hypothetical protein DSO57_1022780 [Entomophthora muscae]|uniref:Uncharacterized protein n=1 Tax=Entomophthora muscae TaxID=34485 RepID=A0ACC2U1S3_9FUNG|nr:hypothetical protein DSO57_1022780 [Entomophthora muscae]
MHGKVALIQILTNIAGDQWDGTEDSLYDYAIKSTLIQCLTSLKDDIMFVLYYKLLIVFDNFGEQGKAAAKNRRKKVKKGTFIGAFLAVSAKSFVYYQTNPDFTNGYKYSHILCKSTATFGLGSNRFSCHSKKAQKLQPIHLIL